MSTETEYEDLTSYTDSYECPFYTLCLMYIAGIVLGSCYIFRDNPIYGNDSDLSAVEKYGYTILACMIYCIFVCILYLMVYCYRRYIKRKIAENQLTVDNVTFNC